MNRDFIEFDGEYCGDLAVDEWNEVNRNFIEFVGEICGDLTLVGRMMRTGIL